MAYDLYGLENVLNRHECHFKGVVDLLRESLQLKRVDNAGKSCRTAPVTKDEPSMFVFAGQTDALFDSGHSRRLRHAE